MHALASVLSLIAVSVSASYAQVPPALNIYHFDVNTDDATLIVPADRRDVLIDAGNHGRGRDLINEFLTRAENDGLPIVLE